MPPGADSVDPGSVPGPHPGWPFQPKHNGPDSDNEARRDTVGPATVSHHSLHQVTPGSRDSAVPPASDGFETTV